MTTYKLISWLTIGFWGVATIVNYVGALGLDSYLPDLSLMVGLFMLVLDELSQLRRVAEAQNKAIRELVQVGKDIIATCEETGQDHAD